MALLALSFPSLNLGAALLLDGALSNTPAKSGLKASCQHGVRALEYGMLACAIYDDLCLYAYVCVFTYAYLGLFMLVSA